MENKDEISLLDIAVFIAENWVVLLVAPLVVASAVYVGARMHPASYTATTTLEMPATGPQSEGGILVAIPNDFYRAVYADREAATVSISGSTASITATGASAEAANAIARQIHSELAAPLLEALTDEVEQAEGVVGQITPVLRQVQAGLDENPENAITLLEIRSALAPFTQRAAELAASIDVLQTAPVVEASRSGRAPAFYATLAGIASGFAVIVLLVLRQGMRSAAATDEGRQKMERITNALLLRHSNR